MTELAISNTWLPSPTSDDDRPIAVRRKRRASSNVPSSPLSQRTRHAIPGINTPPATPQRNKKRVRFSDPGPALLSTGLTPFIRRASLGTPSTSSLRGTTSSSRRQSGKWNLAVDDTPISGTLQFAPLRQVLEGRVQRRIRRNRLSEEVNIIESEKKQDDRARREADILKALLAEKDIEIAALREDHDVASQIGEESGFAVEDCHDKIHELETQVAHLRAELEKQQMLETVSEWPTMSQDQFQDHDDDALMNFDDVDFNDHFNDDSSEIIISTPSRRRTFLSPPITAPTTPSKGIGGVDALTQASFPDPACALLQKQLEALEEEVAALNAAIEMTHTTHERLQMKLNDHISDPSDLDSALDKVLTDLALSQASATESSQRFSALANEIRSLGFSHYPDVAMSQIRAQFRLARIELERLHPGENSVGFENSKIVEMLLDRLKVLTRKVHEQDSEIDQYHNQETELRQQLGGRVDAMRSMETAIGEAQNEIMLLTNEVSERDDSAQRLTAALEGYRAEVASLEQLITRMEREQSAHVEQLKEDIGAAKAAGDQRLLDAQLSRDILQASHDGQEVLLTDFSARLKAALRSIKTLTATLKAKDSALSQHGPALALRDARVSELRLELERVNTSLRAAHEEMMLLRAENRGLVVQVQGEKGRYEEVMEAMRRQLGCVIATANGFVGGEEKAGVGNATETEADAGERPSLMRSGGWLRGNLARRISGAKKRRSNSGVGLPANDDVE